MVKNPPLFVWIGVIKMANRTTDINGHPIKLVDLGDGTFGIATSEVAMEGFGATVATRPAATTVPIGFAWMSVATQEVWQSDGTNWVVV